MSSSSTPRLKFVVLNVVAALAFMAIGAVVTYLGRNDPPQPMLVTLFAVTLYLVCPMTCVLTAVTLLRSTTSWADSVSVALNWSMCVFAILFALISVRSAGGDLEVLLGIVLLFSTFAINIHALSGHQSDPASQRTGRYAKKK
jgi:hypothetical protein